MSTSLVVMLTHNDVTVENAIEVFEQCKHTNARFWGFKEKGIPVNEMKDLVKRIKQSGKTAFLEVVDYTEEGCLKGAEVAIDCGFDVLMGTMFFPSVLELVKNENIKYMPFVGDIYGRPSILEGTIDGMIDEANSLIDRGVFGIDLLAYRYTGDQEKLSEEFVKEVSGAVCLAGSISSFERLENVKNYAPWAYTIGSAFFENKFGEGLTIAQQIEKVLEFMGESHPGN